MKNITKELYRKTNAGFHLLKPAFSLYNYFLYEKYLSRKYYIKKKFKKNFGYQLTKDPKSLNEKINWLKINYQNPLGSDLADKYKVRNHISATIGDKYLIPLAFATDNPKKITPENLPDFPFIIKTNHNSSGGIVIRDKNLITNWSSIHNQLRANLQDNYYWHGRERVYKDIKPMLIVEQLLDDGSGQLPPDYKVHCFNGKVRLINVDLDRGTPKQTCSWFNADWERELFEWGGKFNDGSYIKQSKTEIKKPIPFNEMKRLSELLAKDYKYLRVDWYVIKDKLFFGELTLYHHGGGKPIFPKEWDLRLGNELDLT